MANINYEELVAELIKPLTSHPNDVVVKIFSEKGETIALHVMVNPDDLGRVIGKKGRVANAVRTIAYAVAIRQNKRLEIEIDGSEIEGSEE
jgi:predicted RNA-binding protein YlqC (UPF0109 family)